MATTDRRIITGGTLTQQVHEIVMRLAELSEEDTTGGSAGKRSSKPKVVGRPYMNRGESYVTIAVTVVSNTAVASIASMQIGGVSVGTVTVPAGGYAFLFGIANAGERYVVNVDTDAATAASWVEFG